MWLLEFPEWIYLAILSLGVLGVLLGFVLNFIPFIKPYSLPIQIVGVLVLALGVYFQGALFVKRELDNDVADLKVKLAKAESESQKINTVVVTRILTNRQTIKEKGNTVVEYIDREVVKYNDKCDIPKEAIIAHNAAAENKSIGEVLGPNTVIDTKDHNSAAKGSTKK